MSTASIQSRDELAFLTSRAARHLAMAIATLAAIYLVGPRLGFVLSVGGAAILAAGAVAVELSPGRAWELTALFGALALAWYHPIYALFHAGLISAFYLFRRSGWALVAIVGFIALSLPKTLFSRYYHHPHLYDWVNEPHLAAAIFVVAYWWFANRAGRLPDPDRPPVIAWGVLFFFPTHAVNPIAFGPRDLWRPRAVDHAAVLRGVVSFAAKAAALSALAALFPGHGYAALSAETAAKLPPAALWRIVALNYVDLALVLSGTADIAVALARLYGWSLPAPFRWALLAWNPVELWRRWGIYNRRLLLETVYFPLGAGRRRLVNVMVTFLASAIVLHSGWFGSKYWEIGVAGWRDQSLYFSLQGAAVCACLLYWRLLGKDPASDRGLRPSVGRALTMLATQAWSALVHVIVLAGGLPLADRWRLIGRCLGL